MDASPVGRPRCHHCGGHSLYASHSGAFRRLAAVIFLRLFRCEFCYRRVWRFARQPGETRRNSH